jgi:Polyketide cyclase / dehydrase and lipid transport
VKLPRIPRSTDVEAITDATPEQVWAVVSDVTRIGEWSHECRTGQWLDGATGPAPGARFRGRNRVGLVRWGRVCTVTEARAPSRLTYRTFGTIVRDATQWTIAVHAAGTGSRIVLSYEMLAMPRWFETVVVLVMPPHRNRTAALHADLERLGEVARQTATAARHAVG